MHLEKMNLGIFLLTQTSVYRAASSLGEPEVPMKVCQFVCYIPINISVKSVKIIHLSLPSSNQRVMCSKVSCLEVYAYFVQFFF